MGAVGGATLEQFMGSFNELVSSAARLDAAFYRERGVALHSLEVLSYACKDPAQAKVLEEIIRETTNRINALQKKRSENEVASEKLKADLQLELARQDLLKAQSDNAKAQAVAQQQALNAVELAKLQAEVDIEE